jgi:histidinol-phosphate aminotransferase
VISVWDRANPQLRDLATYEPGKPIEETARQLGVQPHEIIKLASNENPLGTSQKAIDAMRNAAGSIHLYPDGGGFLLCNRLATALGCHRENIILGNGSNEIIEFIGHAFFQPGDDAIVFEHAFVAYKLIAALFGARTIEIPTSNFRPNLDSMLAAITSKTKVIFIANPNNPTGVVITPEEISGFLARVPENVITVLDEAYFEFLDKPPDTLSYIRSRNVVILRTFSKIHGLASLRVGYGIARQEIIEILQKTRQPFNVNGIAQLAAVAALEDTTHIAETKRVVDAGRAFLEKEFVAMNLRFVPSAANFVFVRVGDGPAVFKEMLARKIIVRPLVGYGLAEWLRITVGKMDKNRKCIAALKEVLP